MTSTSYLDVYIQFEPSRRITVGFQDEDIAMAFHTKVKSTAFHKEMDLKSERHGRKVSMRLPSRVTEVVASTSALGFYIVFSDENLAKQWQDNLLIWKFLRNSKRKLYVDRDLSQKGVGQLLGMSKYSDRAPGRASYSKTEDK